MSVEFKPKKDYYLEKGKTYYIFENGEILIPVKKDGKNTFRCDKL